MSKRVRNMVSILVLIILSGSLLRLVHLESDGPTTFPSGLYSDAPVKDEAAKGFAARSRCLFGAWSPSPADDYRFWEVLSPVWTWMQYLWFKLTAPGYIGARLFSVLWSALAALFLYLALSRKSRPAGLFAAFFFSFNFYCLIFGRMGLLETPLLGLLIMAFYFQTQAAQKPEHWFTASALWLMAWFVKQSAIIYLPVLVLGFVIQTATADSGRKRCFLWGLISIMIALMVAGALFWSWDYRVRSVMNLRHSLDYLPDQSREWMEVTPARTLDSIRYNLGRGFVQGYLAMFPVAGPLALIELIFIARTIFRTRKFEPLPALAGIWWLSSRAALTLQGQAFPRFYLVQAPSTFILAALCLIRLLHANRERRRPATARSLVGLTIALAILINLLPWALWVRANPRELPRAKTWIMETIGSEDAVVVGEWAGPVCFDTPYRTYYLKNVFNRKPCHLVLLQPTHLLVAENKRELRENIEYEEVDPAVRRFVKWFEEFGSEFNVNQQQRLDQITLWPGTRDELTLILYRLFLPPLAPAYREYCLAHPEETSLKP